MWISALAPLLAEPVKKMVANIGNRNENPESFEQLLKQLEPGLNTCRFENKCAKSSTGVLG